jgi:diguanylate cyclase
MSNSTELAIRGREAFVLARAALTELEVRGIYPTALNYELMIHAIQDPNGAIAKELKHYVVDGKGLPDHLSEQIAERYLPRLRYASELRLAGEELSSQINVISEAISKAQNNASEYDDALTSASRNLASPLDPAQLALVIEALSVSTRRIQQENAALESRLSQTTDEVKRLSASLEQVRRDSMTDALSNLPNRKALDDALIKTVREARANGQSLSFALIDIDHFKKFNDTWGHQAGDQVIRYVAATIGRSASAPRFAARYGGEEFAMLFPGEEGQSAVMAMDMMRNQISSNRLKRRSTSDDLGQVTVSVGVATLLPGETIDQFVERADAALYASKNAGRDRTTLDRKAKLSLAAAG